MERKATDILLELEEKMNKLLSYVANMDNNYKIIISRIENLKNNSVSVALPSNHVKENKNQELPSNSVNSLDENINFINVDEFDSKTSKNNKIRVSQVVKYPKDKGVKQNNVVLASVKIYDSKGREGNVVVGDNRTDQNGRWKIDLIPGNYFVHIVKPASTQKPQIDHYFPISVGGDKSSLDLDPIG